MKHALLNPELGDVRTVIVLGVGRGGTSLVAGCLRALGVCMGENPHPLKHEWSPVVYGREGKVDLRATHGVVQEMNAAHARWGWKSPRDVFQLEPLLGFLRDPGFIFVTRDLVEASLSGFTYQQAPLHISLDETALVYRAITSRLRYWPWPILSVPFTEALRHPKELVKLLCEFMAIDPSAEAREQAACFVQPGTNSYRLFNAKPGDPPLLTSKEDLCNDAEVLAADFSRRYGEEYWRQFETVRKEMETLIAQLRPRGAGSDASAAVKRLSHDAEEARRRLAKRAAHSGYDDLTRLFRVLQSAIRLRHALHASLLAAQWRDQQN
jgi:hypothetical protein